MWPDKHHDKSEPCTRRPTSPSSTRPRRASGAAPTPAFARLRRSVPSTVCPAPATTWSAGSTTCSPCLRDVASILQRPRPDRPRPRRGHRLGEPGPPRRRRDLRRCAADRGDAALPRSARAQRPAASHRPAGSPRGGRSWTGNPWWSGWSTGSSTASPATADSSSWVASRRAVPIRAIGAILGLDTSTSADIERIRAWSDTFVSSMGVDLGPEGWKAKARAHVETQQYFLAEIQAEAGAPHRRPPERAGARPRTRKPIRSPRSRSSTPCSTCSPPATRRRRRPSACWSDCSSSTLRSWTRSATIRPWWPTPSRRPSGSSHRCWACGGTAGRTPSSVTCRSPPARW